MGGRISASQATDLQRQFMEWWTSAHGQSWLAASMDNSGMGTSKDSRDWAGWTTKFFQLVADEGELATVSADMVALVTDAADAIEDDVVCPSDLVPFTMGFVILEEPLQRKSWYYDPVKPDNVGEFEAPWDILLWASNGDFVEVAVCGRVNLNHHAFDAQWFDVRTRKSYKMTPPFACYATVGFTLDAPLPPEQEELHNHNSPTQPVNESLTNWMIALWRIMNEPYVAEKVESPDRAASKRLKRAGMPLKAVREIRLRRAAAAQQDAVREAAKGQLTRRFIVRGHWRNQACGVGRAERKMRWIAPFVKGPEDGEWVKGQKVYRVER